MSAFFEQPLFALRRKVANLLRLGVLRLLAEGDVRRMQVSLSGDELTEAEFLEPYGLTARPLPGSECLVVSLGTDGSKLFTVIAGGRQYRFKGLEDGEVCLYTLEGNCRIHLKKNNTIEVHADDIAVFPKNGLTVGGAGAQPVARVGDQVQIGNSVGKIISGCSKMKVE